MILAASVGLTEAVLWYVRHGYLRLASMMPAVEGDVEYLSAIDEVSGAADARDDGVAEGRPWDIVLPTNLVILNSQRAQLATIPGAD